MDDATIRVPPSLVSMEGERKTAGSGAENFHFGMMGGWATSALTISCDLYWTTCIQNTWIISCLSYAQRALHTSESVHSLPNAEQSLMAVLTFRFVSDPWLYFHLTLRKWTVSHIP